MIFEALTQVKPKEGGSGVHSRPASWPDERSSVDRFETLQNRACMKVPGGKDDS